MNQEARNCAHDADDASPRNYYLDDDHSKETPNVELSITVIILYPCSVSYAASPLLLYVAFEDFAIFLFRSLYYKYAVCEYYTVYSRG